MALSLFFRGVVLGLAIAAPVGPIGVLCIRQTLTYGRWIGFVSGLGAATADGLYGSIAGFGLSTLSSLLTDQIHLFKLIGGIFLCYLGITTTLTKQNVRIGVGEGQDYRTTSEQKGDRPRRQPMALRAYLSTFALTLTNPATILSFTAIFASLNVGTDHNDGSALTLVAGVFFGSALWWLTLSSGIILLKQRFSSIPMTWINRISGSIITTFGVLALLSFVNEFYLT